jgi:tetratricopeptide (TPR) repeat protein
VRTLLLLVLSLALLIPLASIARAGEGYDGARRLVLEGKIAEAIVKAQEAVTSDPEDLASARLLQDLLLSEGRTEEVAKLPGMIASAQTKAYIELRVLPPKKAAEELRKLKSADGAPSFTRLDMAWALRAAGRLHSADSEVKGYLKDVTDDAEGNYLLGLIYVERENPKQARGPLEKSLELEPGAADVAVLLAEVLHQLKEPKTARDVLNKALSLFSAHPKLRLGLAADQVRANELDAAVATLQALTKDHPRLADAHAQLGHVLRRLGELKASEASTRKALEIYDRHLLALETLGFLLMKKEKYQESIDTYALAIQVDAERIEPYVGIGFVQTILGSHEDAEEMLKKALKLDKEHLDANLKMGILYHQTGKWRSAKKHLKKALDVDEENAPAYRYMGYVHLGEGKAKDAVKMLEKALALAPYDAKTVRMLGRAYRDLGKDDMALEQFERAAELDDKDEWAKFDLGRYFDDQGEFEAAKSYYEEAIELNEEFCWPHLYMAEIWDDVDGEPQEALPHYKRFLELGGPDPDDVIKKRIEQIEKG